MDVPDSGHLTVDALPYPRPHSRWVEEWRALSIDCVQVTVAIWENAWEALSLIGTWDRLLEQHSDLAARADTVEEVREIASSGRTAVLYGFQNTAPIEHDIELIRIFRRLGITTMQLTYNLQNYVGSGYWESEDTGLSSRFGKTAVEEMNLAGVLIDLSHCGDRTTLEAIETSARPVAITHSNPREYIVDPPFTAGRLTTLEALKLLADRGGVVGLSPLNSLCTLGQNETVEQFASMIAWTAEQVGVDAVGIGSDYCPGHPRDIVTWWRYARWSRDEAPPAPSEDKYDAFPAWFRPPQRIPTLRAALDGRGFSEAETNKILGNNWLRLFEETLTPSAVLGCSDHDPRGVSHRH